MKIMWGCVGEVLMRMEMMLDELYGNTGCKKIAFYIYINHIFTLIIYLHKLYVFTLINHIFTIKSKYTNIYDQKSMEIELIIIVESVFVMSAWIHTLKMHSYISYIRYKRQGMRISDYCITTHVQYTCIIIIGWTMIILLEVQLNK